MPQCPACGAARVRPSRRRGLDAVWLIVLCRPFRCRDCRARFRAFAAGWPG